MILKMIQMSGCSSGTQYIYFLLFFAMVPLDIYVESNRSVRFIFQRFCLGSGFFRCTLYTYPPAGRPMFSRFVESQHTVMINKPTRDIVQLFFNFLHIDIGTQGVE